MSKLFAVVIAGCLLYMNSHAECEEIVLKGQCSINILNNGQRVDKCDKITLVSRNLSEECLTSPVRIIGYRGAKVLYDGLFGRSVNGANCVMAMSTPARGVNKETPFALYGDNYTVEVDKECGSDTIEMLVEEYGQDDLPQGISKTIFRWPFVDDNGLKRYFKLRTERSPSQGDEDKVSKLIISCAGYSDFKKVFAIAFRLAFKATPNSDLTEGVIECVAERGVVRDSKVRFARNPLNVRVAVDSEIIRTEKDEDRVCIQFICGNRIYKIQPIVSLRADMDIANLDFKVKNACDLVFGNGSYDKARIDIEETETAYCYRIEMLDGTKCTVRIMKNDGKTYLEKM